MNELEELTQSKDAENESLKIQVQQLQAELVQLRGGNFDFDFTMKSAAPLTNTTAARNPFQQNAQPNGRQSTGHHSSPSPSSGSLTDSSIFRSGQSSLATSPENDIDKNSTPNIDVPFDLFSNHNSASPVNFTNKSYHTSPLFSTDLFGNSPLPINTTTIFGQNQQQQNTSPVLDTFATTFASLTQRQSSQNLTNGFNNPSISSTSTAPLSTFTPNSTGNWFDMNDPIFNAWRDSSISSNGGDDNGFDIFDTMFSSMSPGAFNLVDSTGLNDFIADSPINMPHQNNQPLTATGEPVITCPELWEQVKNHPQFDDIDIDQLCAEMRSKAKVCVLSKSAIRI